MTRMTNIFLIIVLFLTACSELIKPQMPVQVTYRGSLVGEGYVAQFRNTSDKYLQVVVTINNNTLGQTKQGPIDIPPHETKEIGWVQGWKFTSGDAITVSHNDYQTLKVKIP